MGWQPSDTQPEGWQPEGWQPAEGGAEDTMPDDFSFVDITGAQLSEQRDSNIITVTGLGAGAVAVVTVSGAASYSKNNGAFTTDEGTVENGDTLQMRITASASYFTTESGTLTVGGVSDTWSVRTRNEPSESGAVGFTQELGFVGFIQ